MEDSPTTSRSKRIKVDKSNRSAAFQKLKELKGSKNKYHVGQLENVYDQVDEKEYSKTVADRQQSDWIVDDGGDGYIEDGREIFDDDLDDESIKKASKLNLSGPRKRKREKEDEAKSKGSIVNMFKKCDKKKDSVKPENENLLSDILNEFKKNKTSSETNKSISTVNKFKVQSTKPSSVKHQENFNGLIDQPKNVEKITESIDNDDDLSIFDDNSTAAKVETTVIKPPSQKITEIKESIVTEDINPTPDDSKAINEIISNYDDNDSKEIIGSINQEKVNEDYRFLIEEDGFDDLIESIDVEKVNKDNRPVIEDDDFSEVIASLDEKSLWAAWDGDTDDPVKEAATVKATSLSSSVTDTNDLFKSAILKNNNGDDVVRFFWWDAVENPYKTPGTVNLFGKIYIESSKSFVSCCLTVKNIPRRLYVLPREKIIDNETKEERLTTMKDVYDEFKKLANANKINEFRSLTTSKSYAFDRVNTPLQSEYLEVRYSPSYPVLNSNYSGKAIEHIFGTSVNPLELFLIERKIKGPNWLDIKSPVPVNNGPSWCKLQLNCLKMENISVTENESKLQVPPIVLMTIDVRTTLNSRNNDTEITMIGILMNNDYNVDKPSPKTIFNKNYCLVTHPKDTTWPLYARDKLQRFDKTTNIIICETETDVLEKFLDIINETDPDLLLGYDCGFQFDIIYRRLVTLKIKNLSRISKLKQNIAGQLGGGNNNYKLPLPSIFSGRPILDIVASVKELNIKIRSYDLDSICHAVLKTQENSIKEIKPSECNKFYETADKIITLVKVTMSEALYISTLIFQLNVIPLSLQITCIAGNILSRTLSGGRAERNEFLLLHAFSEKGYITPDKKSKTNKDTNKVSDKISKKPKYAGGLVLDPKRGFYDKFILLMDFNSLYPSIIQEYNLCFTTLKNICNINLEEIDDLNDSLPKPDSETGVVPTEIRKLVESRRQVKNLMKQHNLSPELKMNYNIRQLALKLTANSMYGCLGATHSRFYAKTFAAIITFKGREILEHTKHLVENLKYEVIYGDTDSLMINSECLDYDKAFEIAKNIKSEVNKHYKMLELDIDGVFKYLLLLHKKKYAAITITKLPNGQFDFIKEYKGLDIVRRDWCQLACDAGKKILDIIFMDCIEEEKLFKIGETLEEISCSVRNNTLPLSSFVLTKQLSKNPNEYPIKTTNHVAIALRMNKTGGRMWKSGDTISFLVCADGSKNSSNERSYHIDEFKKNRNLSIDSDYYLNGQVYQVVQRICNPIEMITEIFLIDKLGIRHLHKEKFKSANSHSSRHYETSDESRVSKCYLTVSRKKYKNCIPLLLYCLECEAYRSIDDISYPYEDDGRKLSLAKCIQKDCEFIPFKYSFIIFNAIIQSIRKVIQHYYQQSFICCNKQCRKIQRKIFISGPRQLPVCFYCGHAYIKKTVTDKLVARSIDLYRQILNVAQIPESELPPYILNQKEMFDVYKTSTEIVDNYVERSRYSKIAIIQLFHSAIEKEKKTNQRKKKKPTKTFNITEVENVSDEKSSKYENYFETSKQDDFYRKVVFW
ncbi:DNA polymerase alpha catalytic subunit [Cotesia glomerata]|nr:DNA polymerase alpha catalytic subunit [Cotesia glomerata]